MKNASMTIPSLFILLVSLGGLVACAPSSTSSVDQNPVTSIELSEVLNPTYTILYVTETGSSTETASSTNTPSLPSATPTPDYPTYSIQSAVSGMLVSASAGAGVPGSEIIQLPASGGAEQQWRFVPVSGTDLFLIQSVSGDVCVDAAGGRSYGEGWVLLQNPCNSSTPSNG